MSPSDRSSQPHSPSPDTPPRGPSTRARAVRVILWVSATVLMLAAASYQERTGPTYPVHGTLRVGDVSVPYTLPRTETTTKDLRVAVPDPGDGAEGRVIYRRYPTEEPFTTVPMRREQGTDGGTELVARLPAQPPAGKLEYRIEIDTRAGALRIPSESEAAAGDGMIVMRYKDPVPLPLLIAHVACMFFAMLFGMRAALGALVLPSGMGRLAWTALGLMTAGGLILGPFVQKHAFGAYWTGIPWGWDLTDNKTLIMWLAWAVACAVVWRARDRSEPGPPGSARAAVVVGALVMVAVYLVPHSFKGSQLDYGQLDRGVPAGQAVETGH